MAKREAPKRVDTSNGGTPLNDAFATLHIAGLPQGPDHPQFAPARNQDPPKRGRLVLRREKAGRGGKTVVVIAGFDPCTPIAKIEDFARALRKACGTGGTLNGREVEIQGDIAPKVRAVLEADGYRVAGP